MSKVSTEKDFWDRVNKDGPVMPHMTTNCWVWTKCCNDRGYGELHFQWRKWLAHRLAYHLHYGSFPKELDICHHCDNPPCVRPDHLFAGTARDNISDMVTKGRSRGAVGTRNASAKLTELDVIKIRELHDSGMSYSKLASLYQIGKSAVGRIVKRHNWTHI